MNKRYIYNLIILIVAFFGLLSVFVLLPMKETFQESTKQIVLLGDSILQNQAYVSPNNAVYNFIPNAICYAKDDSRIIDVYGQIEKITDTSNAVFILSIGGNDLLRQIHSVDYTYKYKELIEWMKAKFPKIRLYLLDIYYPPCIIKQHNILKQWNNFLYSFAREKDLHVIKISKFLTQPEDFTQCIEPSDIGSKKIARTILSSIE